MNRLLARHAVLALLVLTACSDAKGNGGDGDDDDGDSTSSAATGGGGAPGVGGGSVASSNTVSSSATSTSTTSSGGAGPAQGPSSSASGGDPMCQGIFGGACGACLEGACCSELAACDATAGCVDCSAGEGPDGCDAAPAVQALFDCAYSDCQADCFEDPGTGGGGSGGGGGGFDLVNCTGPAASSGTVLGVTPAPTVGYVWPDPAGSITVALYPDFPPLVGDVSVGIYFFAQPGQYDYAPNGTVGCAILEGTANGWSVVDTSQLCEVHLSTLQFASAEGSCNGVIEGVFQGIFSGNAPMAGSFSLPLEVAESRIAGPSCQPPNGPCSSNDECCTQSCSMFIGVCN